MIRIPLVILEGADGSGKTTLVTELEKMWYRIRQGSGTYLPWVTKSHNGPPPPRITVDDEYGHDESISEYALRLQSRIVEPIDSYDPLRSQHLHIVDRAHIGSFVYGNLFRPEASIDGWGELGPHGFARVDATLAAKGGVMAILTPNPSLLVSRSVMRDDPYLDQVIEEDIAAEPRGEFDRPGRSTRRVEQINKIGVMYSVFVMQHASRFRTYSRIGHPYYVTPASNELYSDENSGAANWPEIAYETDARLVAADILGKAIDAQVEIMRATLAAEERWSTL